MLDGVGVTQSPHDLVLIYARQPKKCLALPISWSVSVYLSFFLSSAYVVRPGPTSRKFFFLFFFFFFHSVSNILGASLVKALASGSVSGITIFRTLSQAMQGLG